MLTDVSHRGHLFSPRLPRRAFFKRSGPARARVRPLAPPPPPPPGRPRLRPFEGPPRLRPCFPTAPRAAFLSLPTPPPPLPAAFWTLQRKLLSAGGILAINSRGLRRVSGFSKSVPSHQRASKRTKIGRGRQINENKPFLFISFSYSAVKQKKKKKNRERCWCPL